MPRSSSSTDIDPRLVRLVYVLDQALRIPGTRLRIGLDPILGLIPGGGDALGAILSAAVVLLAVRHGLPRIVVARMVLNVGVDFVVGSIPLLGDLFDAAWKANSRNLRLLERHATGQGRPAWRDWLWVWGLLAALGLLVAAVVILAVLAIRAAGVGLF